MVLWDESDLIDMSLSSKRGQCKLACSHCRAGEGRRRT